MALVVLSSSISHDESESIADAKGEPHGVIIYNNLHLVKALYCILAGSGKLDVLLLISPTELHFRTISGPVSTMLFTILYK